MKTVSSTNKIWKYSKIIFYGLCSVFGEIHIINLEQRIYELILNVVYVLRSESVMFKLVKKDRNTSFFDHFCRRKVSLSLDLLYTI